MEEPLTARVEGTGDTISENISSVYAAAMDEARRGEADRAGRSEPGLASGRDMGGGSADADAEVTFDVMSVVTAD